MKPIRARIHTLVLAALAQAGCKPAPPPRCMDLSVPASPGHAYTLTEPRVVDGQLSDGDCSALCPRHGPSCRVAPDAECVGFRWVVDCDLRPDERLQHRNIPPGTGRRPEGFALAEQSSCGPLEAYLSQAAQLEHASVAAFERLARELAAHGAPAALVARARRAQADEVRHTAATQALLATPGALPAPAVLPVRALESVALENAAEGCVRETYGAAQAQWQQARADWPAYRAALGAIAAEEAAHAELAFAVAAWADTKLDADARARVAAARQEAIAQLRDALAAEPDAELQRRAGVPSAAAALDLHAALARELWS